MVTKFQDVGDFLKKDFWLTFKNSLLLNCIYLLFIPVIRGIANLDNIQSAQCLGQSVALVGIIIMVPITKHELESSIKEIIYTKSWSYSKSIILRSLLSLIIISITIMIFAFVMIKLKCIFPYWEFTVSTIVYSAFLGLLGLLLSQLGNNVVIGYLGSLGYWSLNQLQIIREPDISYLFPIIDGIIDYQKLIVLIIFNGILLYAFKYVIKRSCTHI